MRKKLLSLFLALALLIGQCPAVFAFEEEAPEEAAVTEQIVLEEDSHEPLSLEEP